jgi:hypothetical protein
MARTQQPATHEGPPFRLLPIVPTPLVPTHALQYDRVDPTEFQSLKDEVESLKAEKSAWEAEQTTLAQQSTEYQDKVNHHICGWYDKC